MVYVWETLALYHHVIDPYWICVIEVPSCPRLSQVRERCPPLVRECHGLLPLLEEMEKHTAAFYLSLERAGLLSAAAARVPDGLGQNKPVWQVRPARSPAVTQIQLSNSVQPI